MNDKGLATRKRVPKDAYYFYKSVWNKASMLYLTEKRFLKRPAHVPEVKAYCNTGNVELFINGHSQGVQFHKFLEEPGASVYVWKDIVLDVQKENEIEVKTILENGKVLTDKAIWIGC